MAVTAARGGWRGEKRARRLDAGTAATDRGGRESSERDGGLMGDACAVEWSAIGACGSGERCALAVCGTDGTCAAFAPPATAGSSEWRLVADLSEVWRRTCESEGYAYAVHDVDVGTSSMAAASRWFERFDYVERETNARERSERVKDERDAEAPKPMPATSLDNSTIDNGREVYVYGALRDGARVEVSSGQETTPTFWRQGTVISANFNAAPRVRVEYDDQTTPGEFLVWSPGDFDGVHGDEVRMIPSQECVAIRRVRPQRALCRVRPVPPDGSFSLKSVREGEIIEVCQGAPATWRLARVVSMDGQKSARVKCSERGEELVVGAHACRNRSQWLGSARGWVQSSDDARIPTCEEDAEAALRANLDEEMRDATVPAASRSANQGEGKQSVLTTNAPTGRTSTIVRDSSSPFALPGNFTTKTYDDDPMRRAELLQIVSCAWAQVPYDSSKTSDPPANILACGTKSGHVVVFLVSDDGTADVVAVQRVSKYGWISSLAFRKTSIERGEHVDLFVGCSSGCILNVRGDIDIARSAISRRSQTGVMFQELINYSIEERGAVTCISIYYDLVIAGRASGDVWMCDLKPSEGQTGTNARYCEVRRVSLEPIAGVCWSNGDVPGEALAHVISGATHVVFNPFSKDGKPTFTYPSDDTDALGKRKRASYRIVDFSRGLAPSPDGRSVARCDAYVQTSDLRTKSGFAWASKYDRGRIAIWRVPSRISQT